MTRQQAVNLLAAAGAMTVFGLAVGLMFPLLALTLERNGVSAGMIGLIAAMQPLGILVAGFAVPRAVRRFGAKACLLPAALATASIMIAYPFVPIGWLWFLLRFAQGFFVSTLFSISEAWIVRFAAGPWRTRILSLYTSVLALTFGGGPLIIVWTGIDSALPFAIGAIVVLCAAFPAVFVAGERDSPPGDNGARSAAAFALKAPVLVGSVALFAVIDAACLSFLPIYGIRKGATQETAALMLTAFIYGNVLLQFAVGWLADRFRKRRVMAWCGVATAVSAASIPVLFATPLIWPALVVCGVASNGIYTVALAELGERFSGLDVVAGTAAFSTAWGTGALAGALIAGQSMTAFGPDGLPYTLAAVFALFLVALLWRGRVSAPHAAE